MDYVFQKSSVTEITKETICFGDGILYAVTFFFLNITRLFEWRKKEEKVHQKKEENKNAAYCFPKKFGNAHVGTSKIRIYDMTTLLQTVW